MAQPVKRPTQTDVAGRAGVSRGTVSLVLNKRTGRVPISEATRERVLAAARELGYSPNPIAQMLASGRNRIIGFFTFEETFPYGQGDFHHRYLYGIEQTACDNDFDLLLFTRNRGKAPKTILNDGMNTVRLADGTVFIGTNPDPEGLRRLLAENYPFVLIGRTSIPVDEIDTVVHDHVNAAIRATGHLIEMNHRRLAFLAEDTDFEFIRERLAGCRIPVDGTVDATLTVLTGPAVETAENLKEAIRSLGVTAVICGDRRVEPALRNLFSDGGLRVPGEISVVFLVTTDETSFASASRVSLRRAMVGQIAFNRLIDRIDGRVEEFRRILAPCEFFAGDTTAPR
jgi:DNA-binding LacI/PurR family transcriptional regulator